MLLGAVIKLYYINDTLFFLIIGMLCFAMLLVLIAIDLEESTKKLTKIESIVILFVVLVCLFAVAFIIRNNCKKNSKVVEKSTIEEVTSTEPTTYLVANNCLK